MRDKTLSGQRRVNKIHPQGRVCAPLVWRSVGCKQMLWLLLLLGIGFSFRVSEASELRRALVVIGSQGNTYKILVDTLTDRWPGKITVTSLQTLESHYSRKNAFADFDLIVAAGSRSAHRVSALHPPLPVLSTLLTRGSFEKILQSRQKAGLPTDAAHFSAIFIDQPLARQFRLIGAALPQHRRVAVLLGPNAQKLKTEITRSALQAEMYPDIGILNSQEKLVTTIAPMLRRNDVFLAIADKAVMNSFTVQSLLLTTYRHKVPVIGYSKAYVKAGAVLAVYSSPLQIAKQLAEFLNEASHDRAWSLPPPQYPKYYAIATNDQVARRLGIQLGKKEEMLHSLKEQERTGEPPYSQSAHTGVAMHNNDSTLRPSRFNVVGLLP